MPDTIQEFIQQELDENAGGLKFIDLLSRTLHSPFKDFAENLEDIIRNEMKYDVEILDYTWHRLNKAKMFVYTP